MLTKKNKKKLSRSMRRAIRKWKEPKPFKPTLDSVVKPRKFAEFLGSEVFYPYMATIDRGRPEAEVVITGRTKEGHRKTIVMERKTHSDLMGSFRSQAEIYRQLHNAQRYGTPIATVMEKVEEFNKAMDKKEEEESMVQEEVARGIISTGTYINECSYFNNSGIVMCPEENVYEAGNSRENLIRGSNFHYLSTHHVFSPLNKTGAKCVICGDFLHSPNSFPRDFPAKFKLCCKCSDAWKISNGINSYTSFVPHIALIRHYRHWEKDFQKLFNLEVI